MKHEYRISLEWAPVVRDDKAIEVVVGKLRIDYDDRGERDIAEDIGATLCPRFGLTRIKGCGGTGERWLEWAR